MYFFDTYAIIERLLGNQNYAFTQDLVVVTTKYNVCELYYALLKKGYNKKIVTNVVETLALKYVEPIAKDVLDAAQYRFKRKKRELSYIDCVGYSIARRMKLKFLTGDEQFEREPGVKYVK